MTGDSPGNQSWQHDPANNPKPISLVQAAQLRFTDQIGDQSHIVFRLVRKHPAHVGMPPPLDDPFDSGTVVVRGMRIPRFIAMTMMAPMAGGPKDDGPLGCHASGNAKCRPKDGTTFEAPMGEQSVIP